MPIGLISYPLVCSERQYNVADHLCTICTFNYDAFPTKWAIFSMGEKLAYPRCLKMGGSLNSFGKKGSYTGDFFFPLNIFST